MFRLAPSTSPGSAPSRAPSRPRSPGRIHPDPVPRTRVSRKGAPTRAWRRAGNLWLERCLPVGTDRGVTRRLGGVGRTDPRDERISHGGHTGPDRTRRATVSRRSPEAANRTCRMSPSSAGPLKVTLLATVVGPNEGALSTCQATAPVRRPRPQHRLVRDRPDFRIADGGTRRGSWGSGIYRIAFLRSASHHTRPSQSHPKRPVGRHAVFRSRRAVGTCSHVDRSERAGGATEVPVRPGAQVTDPSITHVRS